MTIKGVNFIGFAQSAQGTEFFKAFSPAKGIELEEKFSIATTEEFSQALHLAKEAFVALQQSNPHARALFLEAIAEEILLLGDFLITRCSEETGLPIARINSERGRTCNQLKVFAQLLRDGWCLDARIDTAEPNRTPLAKSDIRRMLIPLGPVAVFGASNFPLAFSTAGGDTASALAAGCPVIYKAHSAHPGTNELISSAIVKAAQRTGMPEGIFSSLYLSRADALKLVEHPTITAVGFTGSRSVGMLLYHAAVNRPIPIPVYAEMSAINPIVLLEGALKEQGEEIANNLASSLTLGAGQFCTNPGLVIMIQSEASTQFLQAYDQAIKASQPQTMLNKSIYKAYVDGIDSLKNIASLSKLSESALPADNFNAIPTVYTINAIDFIKDIKFSEEIFGPYNLVVSCSSQQELRELLVKLEGQLTATLHATTADEQLAKWIVPILTEKAGRVIFGGYPTGVEVCHAMQHGGPFPSTTDSRSTSVGTGAISRFLRPVAYQDLPDYLLPEILRNKNTLNALRLLNGEWTKSNIE